MREVRKEIQGIGDGITRLEQLRSQVIHAPAHVVPMQAQQQREREPPDPPDHLWRGQGPHIGFGRRLAHHNKKQTKSMDECFEELKELIKNQGKLRMSPSVNVAKSSSCDVGEKVLRTKPCQERGNDAVLETRYSDVDKPKTTIDKLKEINDKVQVIHEDQHIGVEITYDPRQIYVNNPPTSNNNSPDLFVTKRTVVRFVLFSLPFGFVPMGFPKEGFNEAKRITLAQLVQPVTSLGPTDDQAQVMLHLSYHIDYGPSSLFMAHQASKVQNLTLMAKTNRHNYFTSMKHLWSICYLFLICFLYSCRFYLFPFIDYSPIKCLRAPRPLYKVSHL